MGNSVLVVEDNEELRTLLERTLAQRGYELRSVTSSPDAVAALNDAHSFCLVLWDPTTLPLSDSFLALASRRRIPIATIPIGITSTQNADGSAIIAKRLTSLEAVLGVLREYCPGAEEHAFV